MSWVDIQWFGSDDVEAVAGASEDSGGSGATPAISTETDYYVRDENNDIITDGDGSPLSVEGLASA